MTFYWYTKINENSDNKPFCNIFISLCSQLERCTSCTKTFFDNTARNLFAQRLQWNKWDFPASSMRISPINPLDDVVWLSIILDDLLLCESNKCVLNSSPSHIQVYPEWNPVSYHRMASKIYSLQTLFCLLNSIRENSKVSLQTVLLLDNRKLLKGFFI